MEKRWTHGQRIARAANNESQLVRWQRRKRLGVGSTPRMRDHQPLENMMFPLLILSYGNDGR